MPILCHASLRALQSAADKRTVQKLRAFLEEGEGTPTTSPSPGRGLRQAQLLRYDPASVFLLEMMLSIANQAKQYLEEVWLVFCCPVVYQRTTLNLA
jgi:brefeldin A-resistance guanine nucleotide exchange factor 1